MENADFARFLQFKSALVDGRDVRGLFATDEMVCIECFEVYKNTYGQLFALLDEQPKNVFYLFREWIHQRRYRYTQIKHRNGRLHIANTSREDLDLDERAAHDATMPFNYRLEGYEGKTPTVAVMSRLLRLPLLRSMHVTRTSFSGVLYVPEGHSFSNLLSFEVVKTLMREDGIEALTSLLRHAPRLKILKVHMHGFQVSNIWQSPLSTAFVDALAAHPSLAMVSFERAYLPDAAFLYLFKSLLAVKTLKTVRWYVEVGLCHDQFTTLASFLNASEGRVRLDLIESNISPHNYETIVEALIGALNSNFPLDIRFPLAESPINTRLIVRVAAKPVGQWVQLRYRSWDNFISSFWTFDDTAPVYPIYSNTMIMASPDRFKGNLCLFRREEELYITDYDPGRPDERLYPDEDWPVTEERHRATFVKASWDRIVDKVESLVLTQVRIHGTNLARRNIGDPRLASLRSLALFSCNIGE